MSDRDILRDIGTLIGVRRRGVGMVTELLRRKQRNTKHWQNGTERQRGCCSWYHRGFLSNCTSLISHAIVPFPLTAFLRNLLISRANLTPFFAFYSINQLHPFLSRPINTFHSGRKRKWWLLGCGRGHRPLRPGETVPAAKTVSHQSPERLGVYE